jgi:hypothetical protein
MTNHVKTVGSDGCSGSGGDRIEKSFGPMLIEGVGVMNRVVVMPNGRVIVV